MNGTASESIRRLSCLSGSNNYETVSVAITVGQISCCHGRNILFYSKDCSTRVLVKKSFMFSMQSSAKGQKETSDFTNKNVVSDKVSSNSESDLEKVSETRQVDEMEHVDTPVDVDAEMLRYNYEEFELTDDRNFEPEVKEKPTKKLPFQQQSKKVSFMEILKLLNISFFVKKFSFFLYPIYHVMEV